MEKSLMLFLLTITTLYTSPQTPKTENLFSWIEKNTGFEKNLGQVKDIYGNPVSDIFTKINLQNFSVFVHEKGLSYVIYSREKANKNIVSRIDIEFLDTKIKKENIVYEEENSGYSNYYYPDHPEGILKTKSYKKIKVKDIYPGINWILEYKDNQIHQEFEISPYAETKNLRFKVKWADVKLSKDRKILILETPIAKIKEGEIFSYAPKSQREVNVRYKSNKDGSIGFEIENYPRNETLIIDPPLSLTWSTYYGGGGNDVIFSMTVDDTGNIFMTGITSSADFPLYNPGGGSYFQDTLAGNNEIFILKFNSAGQRLWATYFGGTGSDVGYSIITVNNKILLTGYTNSLDLPLHNPGGGAYFQDTLGGYEDALILMFSKSGVLEWATYFGGNLQDRGWDLTADTSGNIFIIGFSGSSSNFPLLDPGGGAYFQPSLAGGNDVFIAKFSNFYTLEWSTFYGGSNNEFNPIYDDHLPYSIQTDPYGNIFCTGFTRSTDFPTLDPGGGAYYQGVNAGGDDIFILKFSNSGIREWATYYGGPFSDHGYTLTIDDSGNVFISGRTWGSGFPVYDPGGGAYFDSTFAGSCDIIFLKFSNSGVRKWATYYGGNRDERGYSLYVDKFGNLWVAGTSNSDDFPTFDPQNGAYYQDTPGRYLGYSIVVLNFSTSGVRKWATYYSKDCVGYAIVTDPKGDVFTAGFTNSTSFLTLDPGGGAYYQDYNAGGSDACIVRFQTPLAPLPFSLISPDSVIFSISPTLTWNKTTATFGINHYSVFIDSIEKVQTIDTSWTLNYTPQEGYHKWFVIAYDDSVLSPTFSNEIFIFGIDTAAPHIDSTTIWQDTTFSGPFEIKTKVNDNFAGIDSVFLFYKRDSDTNWIKSDMILFDTISGWFLDTIPSVSSLSETIRYYIKSFDKSSPQNISTDPQGAPSFYYSFVGNLVGIKENNRQNKKFFFRVKNNSRNEITFIIYLPKKTEMSLKIYSPTGRLIAFPLSRVYSPGIYTIKFKPKTKGIYFYKFKSSFLNKKGKIIIF